VVVSEYCETPGTEGDIILADWSQYLIVEKAISGGRLDACTFSQRSDGVSLRVESGWPADVAYERFSIQGKYCSITFHHPRNPRLRAPEYDHPGENHESKRNNVRMVQRNGHRPKAHPGIKGPGRLVAQSNRRQARGSAS
jgi:hypothetical protein